MDQVIYKVSATYIQFKIAELEGLFQPFQSSGLIPNKEIEAREGGGVLLHTSTQKNPFPQGTRVQ